MKLRLRFTLRFLLGATLVCCAVLGGLASQDTRKAKQFRWLQARDVMIDTRFDPGWYPASLAACFPMAFRRPRVAWVHYRIAGGNVVIAGATCSIADAKPRFEELAMQAKAWGFDEIRFAKITQTTGFIRHSHLDVKGLLPAEVDRRTWIMPENDYASALAYNKETFMMGSKK